MTRRGSLNAISSSTTEYIPYRNSERGLVQTWSIVCFALLLVLLVHQPQSLNGQLIQGNDSFESLNELVEKAIRGEPVAPDSYASDPGHNKTTIEINFSDSGIQPLPSVRIPTMIDPVDPVVRTARNDLPKVSVMKNPGLSPQHARRAGIEKCLAMYFRINVDAQDWRPWTIMHGLLPYGQQSRVTYKGKLYSAVDYLCHNAIGNDTHMMYTDGQSLGVSVGPGVQGHEGQFLAMLAQANVPVEQEIYINGKTFTIKDLIEYEKQGCRQNTELTFKLIGLSHYLESDEIWKNSIGQSWNIERLIYEELKQPINGAACGGTHRLMGLSYAVAKRAESKKSIDGQWMRAKNFIAQYQQHALRYQNQDGSFSTDWFVTQQADPDLKKRLYTTGHIVEWLSFSLPQEQLNDARLDRAVDYLLNLMLTAPALDLEIGPKGHAIHALRIYERRCFGKNSDVENINALDLAQVEKALVLQKNMKPSFKSQVGTPANGVSYPNQSGFGNSRRIFRRR